MQQSPLTVTQSLNQCVIVSEQVFIGFIIRLLFIRFTFILDKSSILNIYCFFVTCNYEQYIQTVNILFRNPEEIFVFLLSCYEINDTPGRLNKM